jgi:hypothetical protein
MKAVKAGDTVCWVTCFGQWFTGIVLSISGGIADVRRVSPPGAVCTVRVSQLQ